MNNVDIESNFDKEFQHVWQLLYDQSIKARQIINKTHYACAISLRQNTRNRNVSLVPGRGFLVQRQHMYRGVTTTLSQHVWSSNERFPQRHRRARFEGEAVGTPGSKITASMSGRRKSDQCKLSAIDHGAIIHDEMCIVMRELIRAFFDGAGAEPVLAQIDPCTLNILRALTQLQWVPVACEWPIWSERWRLATAVDLVVYDLVNQHFVLVELKNGYEYEVYDEQTIDPAMRGPFADLKDCPKNRHLLQLFLTHAILHTEYVNAPPIGRCVVLRRLAVHRCVTLVDLDITWANQQIARIDILPAANTAAVTAPPFQ